MTHIVLPHIDASRPPLFLHAGLHKTGTTYVQSVCASNRGALLERGIVFPADPQDGPGGQHSVGFALKEGAPDDHPCVRWLRDLNAEKRPVFLSSEVFCSLGQDQLQRFRDLLPDRTIIPILFFREWSGGLLSRWQETLNTRGHSLPAFLTDILMKASELPYVNYSVGIRTFAEVFGRERLLLVSYDNARASGTNILDLIFDKLLQSDLRVADLDVSQAKPNEKLTPESAALVRLVHLLMAGKMAAQGPTALVRMNGDELRAAVPELATLEQHRQTFSINRRSELFHKLNTAIFDEFGDRFVNPARGRLFSRIGQTKLVHVLIEDWLVRNAEAVPKLAAAAERLSTSGPARRFLNKDEAAAVPRGDETRYGRQGPSSAPKAAGKRRRLLDRASKPIGGLTRVLRRLGLTGAKL